jgi:uncharacterized protein (DUF4415 family)
MAINRQFGSFVGDWDQLVGDWDQPKKTIPEIDQRKVVASKMETPKIEARPDPKLHEPEIQKPVEKTGRKAKITIWLDQDVLEHFRKTGRDWHPRINNALRKAIGLA